MRFVLIGYGEIARNQHVAAIAATPGASLVAVVSEHGAGPHGVPVFASLADFYASGIVADAATHCNVPAVRFATARSTLAHGLATLIEKPPFATLSQCEEIAAWARAEGTVLATSWHSQNNAAVAQAAQWLAGKTVRHVAMRWIEDVRKWHPGQNWIWEPGGFGVFDPGINGLSILTRIMPFPVHVSRAVFEVPANRAMPIAAELAIAAADPGFSGTVTLDWRGGPDEEWTIALRCDEGDLELQAGGRRLLIDGACVAEHDDREYPAIYAGFVAAARAGQHLIDFAPLRLVADAFLLAQRRGAPPFTD